MIKVKLSEVKPGDVLVADAGFPCIADGEYLPVRQDGGGLYVDCRAEGEERTPTGKHYLDSQVDDSGILIGLQFIGNLDDLSRPYAALKDNSETWVVIPRGSLAFRFGPYTPQAAGAILSQCLVERIPAVLTVVCGPEFDWELARDMRGELAKKDA